MHSTPTDHPTEATRQAFAALVEAFESGTSDPAVETVRTRDLTLHLPDGSWETRRARPRGSGWRIVEDQERHTVWTRRVSGGAP